MKRYFLLFISMLFISGSLIAQVTIDNEIFRKIRRESYDGAVKYGNKKLQKLGNTKKYYKKGIPYHLGLGMVYRKMGNYGEAEKNYVAAMNILKYKEAHGKRKKIIDYDVYDELCLMYLETGNFYEAEDYIKEGQKAREKRFSKTNLLRYRSDLVYGNYFFRIGNADSAYKYFKKYIFYIKNSRHTSKEELNRYADTYKLLTQMELSRNNATQALIYANKNRHLQFHRWTKKEAGKNNLNKILSLNLIAESQRMLGNSFKAEAYNKKAFVLYNEVIKGETIDLIPLLMTRGFMSWDKGNISQAEQDFIKAAQIQSDFIDKNFKTLSEYEKENFYASLKKNFDILNSFTTEKTLTKNSANDSIWNIIYDFHIKTKAIILNESNRMLESIQSSKDTLLIQKFNQWRKLKNELARKIVIEGLNEKDSTVRDIKYSINHLEKDMSRKTSLFEEKTTDPSWKDIKNKLGSNEAAVEIIRVRRFGEVKLNNTYYRKFKKAPTTTKNLTDSIAYMFLIITPESSTPQVLFIPDGNQLEGKHYKFYQNTKLFKIEDNQSYNHYWQPLESTLTNFRNIFISSDGVYNLINPWILKNPKTGNYLIDEVNIINITNTRQLLSVQSKVTNIESVLLLGRPNYSKSNPLDNTDSSNKIKSREADLYFRGEVSDLPGTETEVKSIAEYLNKNNVTTHLLLWNDANEELLKSSSSAHIMHIATHGFFDPEGRERSPMLRSGLLLAGVTTSNNSSSKEDGILTAYEASNLDLSNTDLVVLSACETGLGEVKEGEGVYGLQRAFEVAGVKDLLMSMWKVNDQTTKELMIAFYEELLKNKSVVESFKKAQLKIRLKYPEPLYWGAFKLIGE